MLGQVKYGGSSHLSQPANSARLILLLKWGEGKLSSRWLQQVGRFVQAAKWIRSGNNVSLSNSNRTALLTSGDFQGAVADVQWSSGSHAFALRVDKHDNYRVFYVGVSPPDVDVDDYGCNNAAGIHWSACYGGVCGGEEARSRHSLESGHDEKRIVVGSVVEVGVAFGSDGRADVTITVDGTLRGAIARGLPGPLSPAVFLYGRNGGNGVTFV